MKHLITFICLVLLSIAGTQNAQAQTKEETIAWIKEKLEKHGGSHRSNLSNIQVSPCSIYFVATYNDGDKFNTSFNPSTTKTWIAEKHAIYAEAQIIRWESKGKAGATTELFIRNGESDIHERMIKALKHLATFCEKKKEAF